MVSLARFLTRSRRSQDEGLAYACVESEIEDGRIRRVAGLPIVLCRSGGRLRALGMTCPHSGALLSKGKIVGDCVECPLHGARFALDDGRVRRGPARRGVPTYDVVVRNGRVYVSRSPRRHRRGRWAGGTFR